MAKVTNSQIVRQNKAMKALSDDDRRAAIDASPNVIGFARFSALSRQRDLSAGYRRPN